MIARIFGTTKPPFSGGLADACQASVSTYQSTRAYSGFHGPIPGRWAFPGGKHGVLRQGRGPRRGLDGPRRDRLYRDGIRCASIAVNCLAIRVCSRDARPQSAGAHGQINRPRPRLPREKAAGLPGVADASVQQTPAMRTHVSSFILCQCPVHRHSCPCQTLCAASRMTTSKPGHSVSANRSSACMMRR